jgi:DNA-nicking Smr family endonuclease
MTNKQDGVIHIPIDGVLDLHTFSHRDASDVVEDYLNACLEQGIYEVKIIHGKGKGILRDRIHSILRRNPMVKDLRLDSGPSGWGATIVLLKKG